MKRRAIIFGILTALILCLIWGHSMMPGTESQRESGRILRWLKPLLDPNGRIDDDVFHYFLRKTAHFTEYTALGFCMCGFLKNLPWKRARMRLPLMVLLCVTAAAVDEGIQRFSDGRSAQVRDALLDSAGAVVGIAICLLLYQILRKKE